eukprot:6489795-Amphidinium_carterae.1
MGVRPHMARLSAQRDRSNAPANGQAVARTCDVPFNSQPYAILGDRSGIKFSLRNAVRTYRLDGPGPFAFVPFLTHGSRSTAGCQLRPDCSVAMHLYLLKEMHVRAGHACSDELALTSRNAKYAGEPLSVDKGLLDNWRRYRLKRLLAGLQLSAGLLVTNGPAGGHNFNV